LTGSIATVGGLLPAAGARTGAAPLIAFVSPQSGDYELWTVRLGGSAHLFAPFPSQLRIRRVIPNE
jgi:hypothetical protein